MKVEHRVKLKLLIRLMPGYLLFFGALVLIGLLSKNLLGVVFLFASFVILRYKYNDSITWHSESTKKCILLSIAMFSIASIPLIVFNFNKSLIVVVPVAVGVTWFLYVLGLKTNAEKKVKELTYKKPFVLDNCTEKELVERCKERFKHDVEYKTERAIKHFILKLPHEEIDVNPEQSKKERYRFRKMLE